MNYELIFKLIGLMISIALACIPASIARMKGRSFIGYWIFAFFAFLPALIVSICVCDLTLKHVDELDSSPLLRDSNKSNYYKYQADYVTDTTLLTSGGWKCNKCGKTNPASMGFCMCGMSRGASRQIDEKRNGKYTDTVLEH